MRPVSIYLDPSLKNTKTHLLLECVAKQPVFNNLCFIVFSTPQPYPVHFSPNIVAIGNYLSIDPHPFILPLNSSLSFSQSLSIFDYLINKVNK